MERRRRLPHVLLDAATAVSLVLCVATVILWVRSYCLGDMWSREGPRSREVVLLHGRVIVDSRSHTFVHIRNRRRDPSEHIDTSFLPGRWRHLPADGYRYPWGAAESTLGFVLHTGHSLDVDALYGVDRIEHRHVVAIPLWCPLIGFGVLPAIRLARLRAGRKAYRVGLCPACGYDLRATPDRCPECGAVPTAPSA